jgi:hypothetical protein
MAVRERQTWFLLAGVFAIALVLSIVALITWRVVHGMANVGRAAGDQEILSIAVPDDWSRGRITYRQAGTSAASRTAWEVTWTSSSDVRASSQVFGEALRKAGWRPCGNGLTCWRKDRYELDIEVSDRSDCAAGVCTDFIATMTEAGATTALGPPAVSWSTGGAYRRLPVQAPAPVT